MQLPPSQIALEVVLPELPLLDGVASEEFFFGAWRSDGLLNVNLRPDSKTQLCTWMAGANWWLLSSVAHREAEPVGLMHERQPDRDVCAFRGYLLDPPIHSWSASNAISETLLAPLIPAQPNGIFAFARILQQGRVLELMTDALGVGGLYLRELGDVVLFASNPRFLAMEKDQPDLYCWMTTMSYGCAYNDRHLDEEIRRAPPGSILRYEGGSVEQRCWFSLDALPVPDREINDAAVAEVESCFQQAMSRCLRLTHESVTLPLTSGHDSRRMLAALVAAGVSPRTLTARVKQKQNRDLDAPFASALAGMFNVEHRIVELPGLTDYVSEERVRRLILDGETPWHIWALGLARHLGDGSSLVLDGLAGDVLGETGFEVPELFTDHDRGLHEIPRILVGDAVPAALSAAVWPDAAEVRHDIQTWLKTLPEHQRPDLAFLLARTRRSAGLWSQRLIPSGHVAVYPYLDLDYLATTLRLDPLQRMEKSLQSRCLERYWPESHALPGSRAVPAWIPPGSTDNQYVLACMAGLEQEMEEMGQDENVRHYLSKRHRLQHQLGKVNDDIRARSIWWLEPLLALVHRQLTRPAVWRSAIPVPGSEFSTSSRIK